LATTAFAFKLSQSRLPALAGIFLCADLPTLEAANSVMAEILFTAALGIVLWLLWAESKRPEKPSNLSIVSGFLSGVLTLIRPVSLFFFVPATAYLLLVRRSSRLRAAFGFLLASSFVPLMWAARNYYEADNFTVSSISGIEMLSFRAAGALAIDDPGDFYANLDKRDAQLKTLACEDLKRIQGRECSELSRPQLSKYYFRFARRIVQEHPIAYTKLALRGAAVMMLGGGADRLGKITGIRPSTAVRILWIYALPTLCLAMVGMLRLWSQNRQFFYLTGLVIIYFVLMSSGAAACSRYRVPIMPIYTVSIAVGLDFVLKRFLKSSTKSIREARLPA
jgi:hypothetical protein